MSTLQNFSHTPEPFPILTDDRSGFRLIRGDARSGKTTAALLRLGHSAGPAWGPQSTPAIGKNLSGSLYYNSTGNGLLQVYIIAYLEGWYDPIGGISPLGQQSPPGYFTNQVKSNRKNWS